LAQVLWLKRRFIVATVEATIAGAIISAAATASMLDQIPSVPMSRGDKMRIVEARERRKILEEQRLGMERISGFGDPPDASSWENAAGWRMIPLFSCAVPPFLERYGYDVADASHWRAVPSSDPGGPQLELGVLKHREHAGHTWYMVQCALRAAGHGGDDNSNPEEGSARRWTTGGSPTYNFEWEAPRRLNMLRCDLHNWVKYQLGSSYAGHFRRTPFAKLGGPRGTTARLRMWLQTLAGLVSSGGVSPLVVAHMLEFLQVPTFSDRGSPATSCFPQNGQPHRLDTQPKPGCPAVLLETPREALPELPPESPDPSVDGRFVAFLERLDTETSAATSVLTYPTLQTGLAREATSQSLRDRQVYSLDEEEDEFLAKPPPEPPQRYQDTTAVATPRDDYLGDIPEPRQGSQGAPAAGASALVHRLDDEGSSRREHDADDTESWGAPSEGAGPGGTGASGPPQHQDSGSEPDLELANFMAGADLDFEAGFGLRKAASHIHKAASAPRQ